MNAKKNQLLLGVIIMILGLFALIRPNLTSFMHLGSLIYFFAGLAFLLLYRTKKKSWSLILGGYLTYFGTANFLTPIIGSKATMGVVGAMFFIVPAVIFLIMYFDKNKQGLLIPGSLLLWFGIYLLLNNFRLFNMSSGGLFFICIGCAFLTIYFIRKMFVGKWPLNLGIIFVLIGLAISFRFSPISAILGNTSYFSAILLIGLSAFIILRALKK